MAEAKRREAWNHTSHVLALLYNVNRDPKKDKKLAPRDFHPLAPKVKAPRVSVSILKDVFFKEQAKEKAKDGRTSRSN